MEFIAVLMDPSRNTYLASKTVKVYLIIIMWTAVNGLSERIKATPLPPTRYEEPVNCPFTSLEVACYFPQITSSSEVNHTWLRRPTSCLPTPRSNCYTNSMVRISVLLGIFYSFSHIVYVYSGERPVWRWTFSSLQCFRYFKTISESHLANVLISRGSEEHDTRHFHKLSRLEMAPTS